MLNSLTNFDSALRIYILLTINSWYLVREIPGQTIFSKFLWSYCYISNYSYTIRHIAAYDWKRLVYFNLTLSKLCLCNFWIDLWILIPNTRAMRNCLLFRIKGNPAGIALYCLCPWCIIFISIIKNEKVRVKMRSKLESTWRKKGNPSELPSRIRIQLFLSRIESENSPQVSHSMGDSHLQCKGYRRLPPVQDESNPFRCNVCDFIVTLMMRRTRTENEIKGAKHLEKKKETESKTFFSNIRLKPFNFWPNSIYFDMLMFCTP